MALLELVQLGDELLRVQDHPVAQHARPAGVEDAGGDQVELEGVRPDDDRVAGVAPPLVAHHDVRVPGQVVRDLALALVSPLGSNDDDRWHGSPGYRVERVSVNEMPSLSSSASTGW